MKYAVSLAVILNLAWLANGAVAAEEPPPSEVAPASVAPPATAPPATDIAIEELTERVRNSLVVITSTGRDGRREGMGAGFVVAAAGLVATNYHVIGEGRALRVTLADGRQAEVTEIHASDRQLDLAVLRVSAKDLTPLELGDSDLVKQGQSVIALGNPLGLKHSVVSGVVSSVREMEGRKMIQLAIPIEPGNSGGPLVDRQGRVQGIMTMKSLVTPNLGFALTVNLLKPLLAKPNPIVMSRWQTIGALDPRQWHPVFGAYWRQRAGRIVVDGTGDSFGGRSLCLSEQEVPGRPYEMTVAVKLGDEGGAAGLAFCSDGGDRHYGFYPTNGQLRLTRFEGPDIQSWQILHSEPNKHYVAGEWNTLRVRLEEGKIACFVNDEPVAALADSEFTSGKVGLVKFRNTEAEFKGFRVGSEVPRATVPTEQAAKIVALVQKLPEGGSLDETIIAGLSSDSARAGVVLRERAAELDRQAKRLRDLAKATHERHVIDDLLATLSGEEAKINLFRAGLLVARLDNEEVDVDAYCKQLDDMAADVRKALPEGADESAKLAELKTYLFEENGFHGSRSDYYNRANRYLNEVIDDREGLPITLSVVYMELARRIGVNVVGVGLPGHFIVAHVPAEGPPALIDVFDGATPITRDDAMRRIEEAGGEVSSADREELFAPSTKRSIVFRMLQNLLSISQNDPAALHRYLNAMLAIDTTHGPYHLLRAMVRYQLDERAGAREDVVWLLEHEPAGVNLDRVRALETELNRE
jgi:S1-C subfamily serine protease/regulator of sirC expression with transglutaminase-like and TPR domain